MNGAVRDLQVVFEVGPLGGLSDGQLVERFVERREEAVFEAIVRRHGPMVWGVCRRVLRDHHDAEEAFQTTFVVLARKAASLMNREKLGNWLYGVAYQTALKARAMRARRRGREVQVPELPEPGAGSRGDRDGLAESLDGELSRLPEKYRAAIILCELEGRSHREAAGQLGWPVGTVSSRLSRARAMLARRLARRGVTLTAGGLAAMVAGESAAAGMPAGLVGPTVQAAGRFVAGGAAAGAVPAGVAALTREVLNAMVLSKIKTAVAALVAGAAVATGIGLVCMAQATGPGNRAEVRQGPSDPQKTQAKGASKASAKASSTRTPRVASASPDDGEANVDPATRELRVTFEQDMDRGGGFSFVGGGPRYPGATGTQPRWLDARTIVLPMKLKPNQDYELSINSARFQNFTNTRGKPAAPYPIRFRTGDGQSRAASKAEAPPRTPRVASASPDDGETNVDPATRELRVTFDQDMDRGGFSIVGGGPTFPGKPETQPRWVDARTVVMPLALEPNRNYQLSINSARFQNFTNTKGKPAVPYPIQFRTGTGKGAAAKAGAPAGPPRVASASPDDGAMDVEPATRELRVTFDQDMDRGGFSITGGGPSFPGAPGTRPRWLDARTVVMPLKMEPNRGYELSINSARFQNFRNTEGQPAVPYPIRFRTGRGTGPAVKGALDKGAAGDGAAARAEAPAGAPRVASASPDDGAMDVDPSTRELRVTFDQDMDRGGFSITGGGPSFPAEPETRPRWVGARTIVMPLALEPNRAYQLSINSARFQNFRNTEGQPATPYPIRFRTRSGKGEEDGTGAARKLAEGDNREAIERLRTAIDEDYSYRDLHAVDWDAAFQSAADPLIAAGTPLEFAKRAAAMLAPARDMHLWLKVGEWHVPSFDRKVATNMDRAALQRAIPGLDPERPVAVGRFRDGITYILIATWSGDTMLDAAYGAVGEADAAKGLIVDVRPNGGGSETLAREFAGCFLDATRVYSKHTTRRGGAFSRVRERSAGPNPEGPTYRGKVAVLMGPANMSSCESFLLMMKQVPGCTLVGERSYGSSGNPQPVDLGNGVTAFLPSWKDLRPDGTCLEGEGVAPDVEVKAGPSGFAAGDPVLEAAVAILSRK